MSSVFRRQAGTVSFPLFEPAVDLQSRAAYGSGSNPADEWEIISVFVDPSRLHPNATGRHLHVDELVWAIGLAWRSRGMFSGTTTELSTTMPTARVMPVIVRMFRLPPVKYR